MNIGSKNEIGERTLALKAKLKLDTDISIPIFNQIIQGTLLFHSKTRTRGPSKKIPKTPNCRNKPSLRRYPVPIIRDQHILHHEGRGRLGASIG